jgi:hypothetical protein
MTGLARALGKGWLVTSLHHCLDIPHFLRRALVLGTGVSLGTYRPAQMTLQGVRWMLGRRPVATPLQSPDQRRVGAIPHARDHPEEVSVAYMTLEAPGTHREKAHFAAETRDCQAQEMNRRQLGLVATDGSPFFHRCRISIEVVADTLGMLLRMLVLALSVASVIVIVFCRPLLAVLGGFRVE